MTTRRAALALASATPGTGQAAGGCTGVAEGQDDDFHAFALLSPDAGRQDRWPGGAREVKPGVNLARTLARGETGSRPRCCVPPNIDGEGAHVDCTLRQGEPDGKALDLPPASCRRGMLSGPRGDVYRSPRVAGVMATRDRAGGCWPFEVAKTDRIGGHSRRPDFCSAVLNGGAMS